MGLAGLRVALPLGIERANAALPAGIQVDEGATDSAPMVEAELRLADAAAGDLEKGVVDVVACAQMA
ncbi:hypothetical protein D3C78_1789970 [compost metagenome]